MNKNMFFFTLPLGKKEKDKEINREKRKEEKKIVSY